ncbi:MAG: DUF1416 domain-containing protein [Candidatus Dormibacteria bacterium]
MSTCSASDATTMPSICISLRRGEAAVERAWVRLTDADGEFGAEVRLGPHGRACTDIQPGVWDLTVMAPEYREQRRVSVRSGDRLEVEFLA